MYVHEHPDLTQEECCKNLGISLSTLARWKNQYLDNNGDIPTRGSGNYASDEQKEIAQLKREWLVRFKIIDYPTLQTESIVNGALAPVLALAITEWHML